MAFCPKARVPSPWRAGPLWPGSTSRRLWTQLRATFICDFWDGEHRTYAQSLRPGFLFPTDRPDTLLVGREKEVGLLHLATNKFHALATIDDANPRTIINDGEIVPGGRAIVFGTKDVKFADAIANLYLFTLDDNKISVLADQQLCSNGKVFARDGSDLWLYDIDTPKRNVVRYRLDIPNRRVSAPMWYSISRPRTDSPTVWSMRAMGPSSSPSTIRRQSQKAEPSALT